ncbi:MULTISPECIES: spore germination protein [Bacillaceae]|jgi:stage V sporulation protein AF|uniref:Stage V sporulation protein AF n=1 Tax=Gottfriedia luciferensis TaxID=178774 RepID=A0ABX3A2U0_9BACI|nr:MULTISPECIES: spore germination protein [Bacillaceae]ODG93618.1 stage V sporulation protein AF [Gottfriedia luciferensis]PGZ91051.1 spore germination protein [Bacillus sp. AFS029533]SFC23189.1 stage V sporulation protein AF [Bacillus sp. UNCCL81]
MTTKKEPTKLTNKLVTNAHTISDRIGYGVSFDVGKRVIFVNKVEVNLYYVNGLTDTSFIQRFLDDLIGLEKVEKNKSMFKNIEDTIVHQSVEIVLTFEDVIKKVLSGLIVVLVDGEDKGLAVDVRSYPGRGPTEPDTERVVRGSRDGFTENIINNTGLIRRRIRDENLRNEILQVGESSKTDVCLTYIEGLAHAELVKEVRDRITGIHVDGLTMTDKKLEEFILKQGYNPFPLVRYSERPDVVANHILEGHVCIIVDTSPSVIITPATYYHHMQHAEEFRQTPSVGTFLRWCRYIGIFMSVFLLPFWLLLCNYPEVLPKSLSYIGPKETSNIPIYLQLIIADMGIEFLRMASIHTPNAVSTSMGIIAAVLIGQVAIDVGLFQPEVVLYTAVSMIGSYATPSYELALANKLAKFFILILTAILGVKGFMIGSTLFILFLASLNTLNTPYFWPFIPFDGRAFWHLVIRTKASESQKQKGGKTIGDATI